MRNASWSRLLKIYGPQFLAWERGRKQLLENVGVLADTLANFLGRRIQTSEDALAIWTNAPNVLHSCNDQGTYDLPMAAEAYAWLHLPERYARSWLALEELVMHACLPLGRLGVNILDVGTGPGPSSIAAEDFYQCLCDFATEIDVPRLVQPTSTTVIEFSERLNSFRHHMVEYLNSHLSLAHALPDFLTFSPAGERLKIRRNLLLEESFDEVTGEYEPDFTMIEANNAAQPVHRYRLVVFSNFLTTPVFVERFAENIRALLSDLRPGAVVVLIGGTGGDYPDVHSLFAKMASEAGLRSCLRQPGQVSVTDLTIRRRIRQAEMCVYDHIAALAPSPLPHQEYLSKRFAQAETLPKHPSKSTVFAFRKPGRS